MEVYILDALLRPIDVVDAFESMVWTERFHDVGEFELQLISTMGNRKRFVTGTKITINESLRVMEVDSVDDKVDSDGRKILVVKGPEISEILKGRTALGRDGEGNITPAWFISDTTPADVMREMFEYICVTGGISTNDVIPLLNASGTLYPVNTIPEPEILIDWEQKPSSLYAALKELADIYDLGFRLYRNPLTSQLYFDIYAGSDRTTDQTTLSPVVFSPDMENVLNTNEYTTTHETYNVAHVLWVETIPEQTVDEIVIPEITVVHSEMVYADEDAPDAEGMDRRVLMVTVTDVPEEVSDVVAYLRRIGRDELMKVRPLRALDGEISQHSQYKYEQDYYLGDLVEMRDEDNATSQMRVVEQVFVQDNEGQRSYPTLLIHTFVHPGTWASWKYNIEWSAMGAEEYWANQE